MTEAELSKITSDFHMTKPFRRKSFIAMLLGFYPCDYTRDYEDNEIMYGQKSFDKFDEDMNYISCKRLLLKFGFRDEKLIHKLYEENRKKFDDLSFEYKEQFISHKLPAFVFRDFPGKDFELEVFNRYNKGTKTFRGGLGNR